MKQSSDAINYQIRHRFNWSGQLISVNRKILLNDNFKFFEIYKLGLHWFLLSRDLYKTMDTGATIPPIIMLQVLHSAFPAFAERGEQGGYQQQDANECWMELMKMLQQKTKV